MATRKSSGIQGGGGAGRASLAIAAIMAIIGFQSSVMAEGPRLTGWMENFRPATEAAILPDSALTDDRGRETNLSEYRGSLVLLNFWATWCGPCIREMPSLERLHVHMAGEKDFAVLAISIDRQGWAVIEPFRKRLNLRKLSLLHDAGSRLFSASKSRGLPTTILVGPDGRELGRLPGPAEWDSPEAIALIRHYLSVTGSSG